MITQGFRELIINEDSVITSAGVNLVNIDGIGTFDSTATGTGVEVPAVPAALGVYTAVSLLPLLSATTVAPPAGDVFTIQFFLSIPGRTVGELFPEPVSSIDFTIKGDGVTKIEDLLVGQILAGFNDKVFTLTTAVADQVIVTFQSDYEGVGITHIHSEKSVGDVTYPTTELVVPTPNPVPESGLNTGRDLEANVRLATPENSLYSFNPHGQGIIYDPKAEYTAFTIVVDTPLEGWARHEAMGHQDVNQQLAYKNFKYIIYANQASVSGFNATSPGVHLEKFLLLQSLI